jgi:phage terminase small subunit
MDLSDKQIRFCQEYVIEFNATQSAINAGYSESSARSIASELLTKPNIKLYIKEIQSKKVEELNVTFNMIALGVYDIAKNDEARHTDQLKAYDQLAKLFGHYGKDNEQKKSEIKLPTTITFTKGAKSEK